VTPNPALPEYLRELADTSSMAKCTRESHEAAKGDGNLWASMKLIGIQESCPEYSLELRNCALCGSTLAIRIPMIDPVM
jgi:hypothetical protein